MNKSRTFYYLTKPWEDKDLIESISEALKHYHAGFIRKERERHAHAIMIESEKMANLGNYVAGIAHNLRNMVFPFVAYFDAFREDLTALRESDEPKGELFEEYTKEMLDMTEQGQQSVDQVTSLVDSMMALCRSDASGKAETFDLADVIKSAICVERTQKGSKAIDIYFETQGTDFNVLALRGVVSSMVMEFLKNAKYAILERTKTEGKESPTGNIWVSIHAIKDDDFGDAIRFSVRDDGCGMSPEIRKEIFTPLFTTKKDVGTGLGLSFAYAIVQAHRGRIEVESEKGHGTTFTVTLPKTSDEKIELVLA